MASLKIKDYTIEELLQFANIYEKRIEDVTKEEIIAGIDQRLVRSMQLQRPGYTKFFHKIKELLLKLVELMRERTNEAEEEDDHDGGWTEAYKEKVETPLEEAKTRGSSTQLIDEDHSGVRQLPLSPELEISKLDYSEGKLNKLFRQKAFYSLIINSQHRKLIQYPNPEIDLDKEGGGLYRVMLLIKVMLRCKRRFRAFQIFLSDPKFRCFTTTKKILRIFLKNLENISDFFKLTKLLRIFMNF